ncbi:Putative SOS response-associated peptidase YedK [Flavobacteriaceae bacterium MAR_2010_188]|nr:Putative SOS response-associated peptidase YedK [Flavobacteriaceae bacterium MAR_2010_188]
MCYRTEQTKKVKELELHYNLIVADERLRTLFDEPNYHINGFAHPNMLIIPMEREDVLAPGVWGIVPPDKQPNEIKDYHKEAVRFGGGLNAQSEKLFQNYLYKTVALSKRCIIPVSGFYEPHTFKNKSYPYYIHRADEKIISIAGIYTVIGKFITFSLLTKKATPLFEKIHNKRKRQPVLLTPENEKIWLDKDLEKDDVMQLINTDFPDKELDYYTITKDIFKSSVDTNKPSVSERVDYPELQETLF